MGCYLLNLHLGNCSFNRSQKTCSAGVNLFLSSLALEKIKGSAL